MYYLRVRIDNIWGKYKFKNLDLAYEWLSTNRWQEFSLFSEVPYLFKDKEFNLIEASQARP